jgi:hypothetical protein
MFSRLPLEIVHRILAQPGICTVSDDAFTDSRPALNSAQAKRNLGAAYLLVCKTWLRVGTPLVYETIVLNSAAQAGDFRTSLINTPLLGSRVRKLRIHRCFEGDLREILPSCPQITDLYISFGTYPDDQVNGLGISLEVIRPTRVIVQDPFHASMSYFHEPLGRLYSAIYDSIHTWRTLVSNPLRLMPRKV